MKKYTDAPLGNALVTNEAKGSGDTTALITW